MLVSYKWLRACHFLQAKKYKGIKDANKNLIFVGTAKWVFSLNDVVPFQLISIPLKILKNVTIYTRRVLFQMLLFVRKARYLAFPSFLKKLVIKEGLFVPLLGLSFRSSIEYPVLVTNKKIQPFFSQYCDI